MILTIETLWSFVTETYARPGVEAACLEAQDRFGADVGLVLSLHWLDRNGRMPTAEGWQALSATSAHWQREMLAPHRARRRAAKGTPAYEALKAEELVLEKDALAALVAALKGHTVAGGGACLRRYGQALGVPEALITVLEAA